MGYDAQDIAALLREHPHFEDEPPIVRGPNLTFRKALPSDAEFILSLRLDPAKNRYLSKTPPSVEAQREWLSQPHEGYYFIIEHAGQPVGTIRLYDQRGTSVAWGSWILSDEAPKRAAVESTCMIYEVGLDHGFKGFHFNVHKANEKVWQYHERWRAERVGETELDYSYRIDKGTVLEGLKRYGFPATMEWLEG